MRIEADRSQQQLAREVLAKTCSFQDQLLADYPDIGQALNAALHSHLFAMQLLCGAEADRLTDYLRDFLKRNTCACCGKRRSPDRC